MKKWTAVAARIQAGFESSSEKTPEFKAFASSFKAFLKKELAAAGAELAHFGVGHFDCYGFFQKDGKIGYFSISEVRNQREFKLLYRTAAHLKDYMGGHNHYVDMSDSSIDCTAKLIALLK
jgi:hypothetical protein